MGQLTREKGKTNKGQIWVSLHGKGAKRIRVRYGPAYTGTGQNEQGSNMGQLTREKGKTNQSEIIRDNAPPCGLTSGHAPPTQPAPASALVL